MLFKLHVPAPPLDRFIRHLIYYEGYTPVHSLDRFLPDGNTELLIDLSEAPQHIYDNETLAELQVCRGAWVSGVRTQPITIPSGRGSRMLIVAFDRGRAHPFYPFPMSEIADRVVDADLVFGNGIHLLREQLLSTGSPGRMFALLERFLLGRAADSLHRDGAARCVDYAVDCIVRQPNDLSFEQLSRQIGYSRKHLIELFRRRVGVPPKQYLKIARFQKTVVDIETGRARHWSELALRNGFYDQAHFIHDFKDFSGFTPEEYLRRKGSTLNYVPVG